MALDACEDCSLELLNAGCHGRVPSDNKLRVLPYQIAQRRGAP